MVPAQQRFHADDGLAIGCPERLVGDRHLVTLDGVPEIGLEGTQLLDIFIHRDIEADRVAAAFGLGPIHRNVGPAQQFLVFYAVQRADRDTNRAADQGLHLAQLERTAEALAGLLRQSHDGLWCVPVRDDEGKLVTAEAGHGQPCIGKVAQSFGHRAQQFIAFQVAVTIIDLLETIQVDINDADQFVAGACRHQRLELALEGRPVEQSRQGIAHGHIVDLRLDLADQFVNLALLPA